MDPGLGKTSITIAAIKLLMKKGVVSKTLIIAPLRVCYSVWPNEISKWSDFDGLRISILHGAKKEEALKADADIYIINPEGLEWLLQAKKVQTRSTSKKFKAVIDVKRFKKLGFDTLVVDELSKFKHYNSLRFKMLKLVLDTFRRRWGLTGSPAPNGLMDLFGQCYIIDQGRALGEFITSYRMNYFEQSHDGFSWTLRPGCEKEIYKRISPMVLRMSAEDYLDMPKLIENDIYVELPKLAMKTYLEMEKELITNLENRVVVAANAAVASSKCRQVANGGLYHDKEPGDLIKKSIREWGNIHYEKVDALEDLVDELQGSPLLVAYDFAHDLDRLRRRFPSGVFACDYNMDNFPDLEAKWNRGEISLLFGHPQSIGHGLNLQETGHHVCWHSLTWDYELYDQFIRRVLRQGNKAQKIFVHHIIARNTIDEVILATIKSKKGNQDALFEGLKKLARSRK
jgi:SNF2 family DNA or RNA helicase